jgi:ribonuclease HI
MHSLPVPAGGHAMVFADANPVHTLYIDGSAKRGTIGGGALLVTPEGEFTQFWRFDVQSRDSNQAEILALRNALEWVAQVAPARTLQVYTDSYELLLHLVKRTERYLGLQELPELIASRHVVRLQNIANEKNKRADALARKALGI